MRKQLHLIDLGKLRKHDRSYRGLRGGVKFGAARRLGGLVAPEYSTGVVARIESDREFQGKVDCNNRGLAYSKEGQYDKALLDFGSAISMSPDDAIAFNNRAGVFYKKREYVNAVTDYSTAIHLAPNSAATYNNRGYMYSGKGEFDKAMSDYNTAIRLDQNFPNPYRGRALIRQKMGDVKGSEEDLQTAARIEKKGGR